MAKDKTTTAKLVTVVEVSRNQLSVCSSASAQPAILKLPPSVAGDLEVINPTELEVQIKAFISQAHLPPSPLVIVISAEAYFETELALDESEWGNKIQEFLDSVPLISVSHKVFDIQGTRRLIAINRRTYEMIKQAFESLGFAVIAVVPAAVLLDAKIGDQLTAQSCRLIRHKLDHISENSFLVPTETSDFEAKKHRFVKKHQALLGILSVMFIAFGITMTMVATRRPPRPAAAAPSTPRPAKTSPAPVTANQLTVQILASSASGTQTAELTRRLQSLGLTNVQTATATGTVNQTLIVFSSRVPETIKGSVISTISQLWPNPASQTHPQAQYDLIITLAAPAP